MNSIISPKDLEAWAEVLCSHSLKCTESDRLFIYAEQASLPLVKACIKHCTKRNIISEYSLYDLETSQILLNSDSISFLTKSRKHVLSTVSHFNKYLFIYAQSIPPLNREHAIKLSIAQKNQEHLLGVIMQKKAEGSLMWCRTDYPTEIAAKQSGLTFNEYWHQIRNMSYLTTPDPIKSWELQSIFNQTLIDFLKDKKTLRIVNDKGTDLTINIKGMNWSDLSGTINFPDGEVFSAPNDKAPQHGLEGTYATSFRTLYKNVYFDRIQLTFENGVVTKFSSNTNQDLLESFLNIDEGAKRVGEIAIGTNFRINQGLCNILYDEKIGGTFHLALGKAYPETGNSNQSALHWDLITDLRQDGKMEADGKVFFQNGIFTDPQITSIYSDEQFNLFQPIA